MSERKPKLGDLNFDAIREAQEFVGDKDSKEAQGLGLALHLINSQMKEARLSEEGDTYWRIAYPMAAMIYMSEGFEPVLETPFTDKYDKNEVFFVYANFEEGLLLLGDTFDGRCNRSTLYYNAVVHSRRSVCLPGSSSPRALDGKGFPRNYPEDAPFLVIGDMDCREGFRHKLQNLRNQEGLELLPRWRARGWMGLYHHGECPARGPDDPPNDMDSAQARHIAALPEIVRKTFVLEQDYKTY